MQLLMHINKLTLAAALFLVGLTSTTYAAKCGSTCPNTINGRTVNCDTLKSHYSTVLKSKQDGCKLNSSPPYCLNDDKIAREACKITLLQDFSTTSDSTFCPSNCTLY